MSPEQLQEFRKQGKLLDPKYDLLANAFDNHKKQIENQTKEKLSIKYLSSTVDDKNINLTFEVSAKNLKTDKATIYVQEMNANNEEAVPLTNIKIDPNGTKKITVPFSKDKKFDIYFWQSNTSFQATINCDNFSAQTTEFKVSSSLKVDDKKDTKSKVETCFCNRNFTEKELKNIIIKLRKADSTGVIQTVRDKTNTKNFAMGEPVLNDDGTVKTITLSQYEELGEDIFKLEMDEVIVEKEANYGTLTYELNKAFRDYNLKTCLQKMHFLSQAYHETQRFTSTYEANPSSKVIGGAFYRGRGLLHLTHKPNYEELFTVGSGEEPTPERLEVFVPTVATSIKVACQASGWYWKKQNINQYIQNNEAAVVKISAALNYPKALNGVQKDINSINGLAERKLYFNLIKPIFKYDEICKNKI